MFYRVPPMYLFTPGDAQTKIDLDGKKCAHQENVSFQTFSA